MPIRPKPVLQSQDPPKRIPTPMDYQQLLTQRRTHPAWRLLAADNAPMIASFLHASFIVPNVRTISRQQLASQLDDHLFHLHDDAGETLFPKAATAYLDDWASDERGWLRKYYPAGQDEAALRPRLIDRTGDRLAARPRPARLHRHRVAPDDGVRPAAPDRRRHRTRSARPHRRTETPQGRDRCRNRADRRRQAGPDGSDPGARTLPADGGHRARTAVRFPRGRPQLPHARSPGARTDRDLGRQQGRAAAGDLRPARPDLRDR